MPRDEITVRGQRLEPGSRPLGQQIAPPPPPDPGPRPGIGGLAFVAPALPSAVEEIVVTGTRTAQAVRTTPRAPRVTVGALIATVGGLLIGKIVDELGQQMLDAKMREWESIRGRVKPDTPLEVQPQPQPVVEIPEIIVTARRRSGLIDLWTGGVPVNLRAEVAPISPPKIPPFRRRRRIAEPPSPQPPGPRDPRRRDPRRRRRRRRGRPFHPTIRPFRPGRPLRITPPGRTPQTTPTRRQDPRRDPRREGAVIRRDVGSQIQIGSDFQFAEASAPGIGALAGVGAGASFGFGINPIFGNPLTGSNVGSVVFEDISPEGQPQQAAGTARRCQPCPKPKPKRRKKCYVKYVEERSFERWDKVRKWREIDCLTGRPK